MFGFSRLGPLEVMCDAPSYKVVQACRRVGVRSPEDVRWCRLSGLQEQAANWRQLIRSPWKLFGAAAVCAVASGLNAKAPASAAIATHIPIPCDIIVSLLNSLWDHFRRSSRDRQSL